MAEIQSTRLQKAIAALRDGDRAQARALILEDLRVDPNNLITWMWALEVANSDKERRSILGKILKLDPNHKGALQYLQKLDQSAGLTPETFPPETKTESAVQPDESQPAPVRIGSIIKLFAEWLLTLPVSCGFIALFAVIVAVVFIYFRVNTSFFGLIGNDIDNLVVSNSFETISSDDMVWEVQFEGVGKSNYIGTVRYVSPIRIDDFRILTHDILVTTEDFSNPDLVVTNVIDHKFFWRSTQTTAPNGSINLIHGFPANKDIYQELLEIQNWDTVEITGREIYTVKAYRSDNTFIGTWIDTGCNTLLIQSISIIENPEG